MRKREIKKEIQKQERFIQRRQEFLDKMSISSKNSLVGNITRSRIDDAKKKIHNLKRQDDGPDSIGSAFGRAMGRY